MGSKMEVKVYLVLQRINLPKAGEPDERVIAARLTREAAQRIVDRTPGTRIDKHLATK